MKNKQDDLCLEIKRIDDQYNQKLNSNQELNNRYQITTEELNNEIGAIKNEIDKKDENINN